jgi:2-keto-4-pentenoate hydratase
MSAASNYLEKAVLDHVLGNAAFTQPSLYLGLWTADDGLEAGTITSEVSGGSYARQAITFDAAVSGAGTADSAATVTFPTATANWGTIAYVAIMDASTSGNVLFHGAVTTSKTIESGDTFQVSVGNLTITLA